MVASVYVKPAFDVVLYTELFYTRISILLYNFLLMKKDIVVTVSGYFDPLHKGHIELFKRAKQLGNKLVVILNNDKQCVLKKGRAFMEQNERKIILEALSDVDEVFLSIDEDRTVCKSLDKLKPDIFANGGDRYNGEIPEHEICNLNGIEITDGLGEKVQSSSILTGLISE